MFDSHYRWMRRVRIQNEIRAMSAANAGKQPTAASDPMPLQLVDATSLTAEAPKKCPSPDA